MGLFLLPGIDGVAEVWEIAVVLIFRKNRYKSRNIGQSVIPDTKKREPMFADSKQALPIEFVLLSMFQAIEKSISIRAFEGHPGIG